MSRLIAASPVAAATADAACASPLRRSARPAGASGEPLREADRCRFEAAFGHSFADVRVHADAAAGRAAEALDARAYTHGRDVVFGPGEYRPGQPSGDRLLAHELAHVVQQRQVGPAAAAWVQRQPKDKTLKQANVATADPASAKSAEVIDGVLRRSKRLAPYIGTRLQGGFSIAEKGKFVIAQSDTAFDNAYRAAYDEPAATFVPKSTMGFFDSRQSIVHLRGSATFGTALHEAMHRLSAPMIHGALAIGAKKISNKLLEAIVEGMTAYFVDAVLADEGLPNFNDAYRTQKGHVASLVAALGKTSGFDLVAKLNFLGNLLSIGEALGVTKAEYQRLAGQRNGSEITRVLGEIEKRL